MARLLTRAALSRRSFLRGASASLALPWLEAMVPALSRPSARPARAAFVFAPNGQHMPAWTPAKAGAGFELSATLEPLAPVRRSVTVITGLALDAGRAHGDGAGDHARAAATFLTAMHPKKTGGADIQVGVSVDQLIARRIGTETRLASLEIGCEGGRSAGICDSGYACAYSNNISWRTPSLPMSKEVRPRAIFRRLFDVPDESEDQAAERSRAAARRSILDVVLEDAKALEKRLGGTDRRRLGDYLDALRDIERRLPTDDAALRPDAPDFATPKGIPSDYGEHLRLNYELLALAFQADVTRVATFMLANAGSNRSYRFLDCPDGHHDTSHHGKDPTKLSALARINRWHLEHFATFVRRLAEIDDGDRKLLDRCVVLYGSGLSDGDRHNHDDLPILLAGHGNGALSPGRHLLLPKETPLANLHLSLLRAFGLPAASFADSTGPLAGI